ncbi:MAG: peptidyl-prolyl cis-trans isomerase [Acidobacteria bacterium]|nr:peptidyl-prolyl cis-trans isomerase [Acidobacteriota bacterium]
MKAQVLFMKLHLTLLSLALLVFAVAVPRADILEQILVKVNGDIITKSDLEQRQIAAIRQRKPEQRPNSDTELQTALSEITPEVIVDFVDELLMVQRGRELGYSLGNEQFQSILENIKKENKIESDEQFQAALKQEGLTMDDLRKQLEKQMLYTRVQQAEVMGKLNVTEDEIKQEYEANRESFTTPPQITLRELLIAVPTSDKGLSVAEDDAAKAKAEDIRRRLEGGEPFARLAGDVSDAASKANGGLIGPISRNDLSEQLQKELEPLEPGDLTPVIRTARGYQILKLETLSPAQVKPFDEARAEIADRIAQRKQRSEFQKYIERLRAQAIIDWKNDEIKRAYEIGVKQRQTAS